MNHSGESSRSRAGRYILRISIVLAALLILASLAVALTVLGRGKPLGKRKQVEPPCVRALADVLKLDPQAIAKFEVTPTYVDNGQSPIALMLRAAALEDELGTECRITGLDPVFAVQARSLILHPPALAQDKALPKRYADFVLALYPKGNLRKLVEAELPFFALSGTQFGLPRYLQRKKNPDSGANTLHFDATEFGDVNIKCFYQAVYCPMQIQRSDGLQMSFSVKAADLKNWRWYASTASVYLAEVLN